METQRIKIASLFIASLISRCHTMHVMVHFLLFITIFLSSLEQAQMSYQQCRWNALFSWILEKCGSMSIAQLGWVKVVEYYTDKEFPSLVQMNLSFIPWGTVKSHVYIGMSICIPWVEPSDTTSNYPKLTQNHDCIYVMKFARPLDVPLA